MGIVASDQRRRRPVALAAGLYAIFLLLVPFTHHDLACHLKTPEHCTACSSTTIASGPRAAVAPEISSLADAGRAVAVEVEEHGVVLPARESGRSPPAFS
jgi:hypothetical protein